MSSQVNAALIYDESADGDAMVFYYTALTMVGSVKDGDYRGEK